MTNETNQIETAVSPADAVVETQPGPDEVAPSNRLEEEGEIAADYLEELLDIADLDGDIDIDVDHGRAAVEIVTESEDARSLNRLIGADGEVLDALQELTRLAVQAKTGERSRLMLDVAGHRQARKVELTAIAQEAIDRARAEGADVSLPAMNPFERKVIHDTVASASLVSDSEGVEPKRHVVVRAPAQA
ncbi:single-stranded DNA-binding protein [Occultella glacieicola]|uniref:Single-stranded DNA-binding protein n=1 Tax=Occultella glacieicola TaxID=2518684 RepID=A0ABY2E9Y3_9MICO|nr:R3H domain-containing nucleic acid-binding protein [Occultella glacieicola]TDE98751.1 single-stranded DNA-binding protein [Occultella glacieicola]